MQKGRSRKPSYSCCCQTFSFPVSKLIYILPACGPRCTHLISCYFHLFAQGQRTSLFFYPHTLLLGNFRSCVMIKIFLFVCHFSSVCFLLSCSVPYQVFRSVRLMMHTALYTHFPFSLLLFRHNGSLRFVCLFLRFIFFPFASLLLYTNDVGIFCTS